MKPKFRSLVASFSPLTRISVVVCATLCAVAPVQASKTWTGATDGNWATTTNWLEEALPDATETAIFNSGSANLAVSLGAARSVRGLQVEPTNSPLSIDAGFNLTLGFNGIDMLSANNNVTLNSSVALADVGAQSWKVPAGLTLTLAAAPTKATAAACPLTISTTGSTIIGASTANLIIDTANNPFVTLGANDWAGLSAGAVVASTYTTVDGVTVAGLVGGAVNDVTGNLTGANGTDVAALRFNSETPYNVTVSNSGTSRTCTARGILVTANSGGGSIGGGLRNNGFIRPNRTSGNPSFNIIQNSASDFTIGAIIANASSGVAVRLVKSGPGKVISLQNNSYSGGTFIGQGVLQFGDGSAVSGVVGYGFPGGGNILNNGELVINRGSDNTLVNNISGSGALTKLGAGVLNLTTSVSTFTGPVNIHAGTLAVTTMENLGAATLININDATFRFLGGIDPSAREITIGSSGATFDTNGNAITLANPFVSGSTGGLTKTGDGSLTLAADNNYSGATAVNAGTLVAAAPSSSTGSGSVTINTGATLAGSGAISGAVTVTSGAKVTPGIGVGTLTVGALNFAADSTATFEFNNSPNNDRVAVSNSGGLSLGGGAITLLQENSILPFAAVGTYNLISYTGSIGGAGVSSLSVANPQPGFSYNFAASGGFVTLTIATTGVVSQWITDSSGSWSDAVNWSNTIPNGSGSTVNLTTTLSAPAIVSLNGSKTVGALTLSSGVNGYTVAQGSGGSLSLNNGANPSTIAINGGFHGISAAITLVSNTTIAAGLADSGLTLTGMVSGSSTLTKTGGGTLGLLVENDFSGNLALNGGTTLFTNGGLGTGNLSISGATLTWDPGNTQDISNRTISFGDNPVVFNTNGNNILLASSIGNAGAAAFTKAGAGTLTLAGNVSFTGAVTISEGVLQLGTGGSSGMINGDIANQGQLVIFRSDLVFFPNLISGTGSLVKKGNGELELGAANTFSGVTSIEAGGVTLSSGLALQNSTLEYASSGGSISWSSLGAVTLGGLSGNKGLVLENIDEFPVALTIGTNGDQTWYSGVLSGSGSLTKLGAGITVLSGLNTYTGATAVSAGDLEVTYGGSITSGLTVNGSGRMVVSGGSLSASSNAFAVNSLGFYMSDGTADFATTLFANGGNGNTNSALIKVEGGVLNAPSVVLGRTTAGALLEAPVDANLYMTGGEVNVAGDLLIGTGSNQPNSTVVTRVDGGLLTVGGAISVGLNNGGRRSILAVNGGTLVSTGTALNSGVVLGGPWAGQAAFHMQNGLAEVERIQFGQGAVDGFGLLRITGGELYLGSGGITLGSTGSFPTEIQLAGGRLGAKASWTSSLPVIVGGSPFSPSTIAAADLLGNPFNIELSGALTGTGSLSKDGAGTLILSGGNSYAGNTTVEQGKLVLTTKTLSDEASVIIYNGAVLELGFSGGDKVEALTLGDSIMPEGIYGRVGTNKSGVTESALIEGNGLLYVGVDLPPAGGYEAWAADPANGLTAGANDGPTQDPDNDGITNLMEFVLGGNPTISSTGVLPKLTVTATSFVFTFNRNDESESTVGLSFQHGVNLTHWTDVVIGADNAGSGPEVSIVENGADPDAITVTIPRGSNTGLFGRLRVVK